MIVLFIYLIGCILSFGRSIASFYEIEEKYIRFIPCEEPKYGRIWHYMIAILSWIGFFVGIIMYIIDNEKYFFKWNFKDLINH